MTQYELMTLIGELTLMECQDVIDIRYTPASNNTNSEQSCILLSNGKRYILTLSIA